MLWRCWLGGRKGIRPVKNWVVGCWRGCLGWGADLHVAQQMQLPLTISCSSKSRLVLTCLVLPFWYLLTRVVPDRFQQSSKTVVCVCVIYWKLTEWCYFVTYWWNNPRIHTDGFPDSAQPYCNVQLPSNQDRHCLGPTDLYHWTDLVFSVWNTTFVGY